MRFAEDNPRRRYERRGGWVDYRMELFKKYCLPSVQAQKVNFDWWFLVDPGFPEFSLTHEQELTKYGRILWIEAPWKEDQVEVGELLRDKYKDMWICSTRLDSDDILRNNYMELVKEQATEEEAWISFPNGYMMKEDLVAERFYEVNPFISYVEYADPFRSVFKINHTAVNKQKNWKTINVPGWIQVDHRDNIKNLIKRKLSNFNKDNFDASSLRENFTWR